MKYLTFTRSLKFSVGILYLRHTSILTSRISRTQKPHGQHTGWLTCQLTLSRCCHEARLIAADRGSCSRTEPVNQTLQICPVPYLNLHP